MYVLLSYEEEICVHGHHLYQNIWTAEVGKSLIHEREPTNSNDRYAVAVLKGDVLVNHLPKKLLLVKEDILQICHQEDLKFLVNYFSVASLRKSTYLCIFFPVKLVTKPTCISICTVNG